MVKKTTIKKLRGRKTSQKTPDQQQASDAQQGEDAKKEPASEHIWDDAKLSESHKPGCVTSHAGWYADSSSNTCSYRGQAKKRAETTDKKYYQWPDDAREQPEIKGSWDAPTPGNFQDNATIPYAHEAHHIVAVAELRNAIIKASEGIEPETKVVLMMRDGLLKEEYNINDALNMMILPREHFVMKALGLPLHRTTARHHKSYSAYIKSELQKTAFKWLKKAADEHKLPSYQSCRQMIEDLSEDTRPQIKEAGEKMKSGDLAGKKLDDIPHELLAKRRNKKGPQRMDSSIEIDS